MSFCLALSPIVPCTSYFLLKTHPHHFWAYSFAVGPSLPSPLPLPLFFHFLFLRSPAPTWCHDLPFARIRQSLSSSTVVIRRNWNRIPLRLKSIYTKKTPIRVRIAPLLWRRCNDVVAMTSLLWRRWYDNVLWRPKGCHGAQNENARLGTLNSQGARRLRETRRCSIPRKMWGSIHIGWKLCPRPKGHWESTKFGCGDREEGRMEWLMDEQAVHGWMLRCARDVCVCVFVSVRACLCMCLYCLTIYLYIYRYP